MTKRVVTWVWNGVAVTVGGFILGILGWLVSALIGGNFAGGFTFCGVRGYEATGLVGFLFGAAIGILVSCRILAKLQKLE